MLRLLIDWASEKLGSALCWVKEMASSFGFGVKKNCPGNDDFHRSKPKATEKSQVSKKVAPIALCGKFDLGKLTKNDPEAQIGCTKCRPSRSVSWCPGMDIAFSYPLIEPSADGKNDEFPFFPHAKVKLVPFVRTPSKSIAGTDLSPPTYAGILKASRQCKKWRGKMLRETKNSLLKEMKSWKSKYGLFSAFIVVDECDECAGDPDLAMCPLTTRMVAIVRAEMSELYGDAFTTDETVVYPNGSRTRMIYVAPSKIPSLKKEEEVAKLNDGETEEERERENAAGNCEPEDSTKKENLDEGEDLEWKLMRRQDYDLKRKQGKANRRRLRQPATCVPVTKNEISLMESKSEPGSMKGSRKRNSRKGRQNESPRENSSEMKVDAIRVDAADSVEKLSKRAKRVSAHSRRCLKRIENKRIAENSAS